MTFYESEVYRIRALIHSNKDQIERIRAARQYIDAHFDTDLNLDVLAEAVSFSKYHLLRLFKRYYGQTLRQYLIDKRLEKAKEFLRSGMKVTETCFAVGFQSPGSFSTLFKRKIGLTPKQYQNQQFSRSKLKSDFGPCEE